jgi:glycosyltransferase involved in cell wall biosynthesis
MHLLQSIHHLPTGIVIVGPERLAHYSHALHEHARTLNIHGCWFTGAIDDRWLATIVNGATAYVSASQHEGLAVPPLEAMALGVPVVIRGAGAVAATVGRGALVLPKEAGPSLFAEAIAEVVQNEAFRTALIVRGHQRVAEVEDAQPNVRMIQLLKDLT